MISDGLIVEIVFLIFIYFKYFGDVIFISYKPSSSNKWVYQNLTAELEKQLPDYTIYSGFIKPPTVFLIVVILALLFYFKGLCNLITKLLAMGIKKMLITTALLIFLTLPCLIDHKNDFGISYEGHTVYLKETPDMEIPNVEELVDIIKEKTQGITFPRGVAIAGFFYIFRHLETTRRRR